MDPNILGISNNDFVSKHESKSILTSVIVPVASLLVACLGLLSKEAPWWVTVTAVFFIFGITLAIVIPLIARSYRNARNFRLRRSIAKTYHSRVLQFLTILSPSLEDSRIGTIFEVYRNAHPLDKERKYLRYEYDYIETFRLWLKYINWRFAKSKNMNFYSSHEELVYFVIQYNRFCKQIHNGIENLISSGSLKEHEIKTLKQKWNSNREKHNHIIKIWEDTAKSINHDVGEKIIYDHYDLLETIE